MPKGSGILGPDAHAACACLNFRMVSRALTQMYDDYLQSSGLRATQFTILSAASLAGRMPLSRLADLLVMDRTTLTRNLGPLERAGLVRVMAGVDRRTREIVVTDRGQRAIRRALPLWRLAQRRFVDHIGKGSWLELRESLIRIVAFAKES